MQAISSLSWNSDDEEDGRAGSSSTAVSQAENKDGEYLRH